MTRATFTPAPIDALPPFCSRHPHVTPADDLARRLEGLRFDSTTSAALFRVIAERIGSAPARRFLEFTAQQGNGK